MVALVLEVTVTVTSFTELGTGGRSNFIPLYKHIVCTDQLH